MCNMKKSLLFLTSILFVFVNIINVRALGDYDTSAQGNSYVSDFSSVTGSGSTLSSDSWINPTNAWYSSNPTSQTSSGGSTNVKYNTQSTPTYQSYSTAGSLQANTYNVTTSQGLPISGSNTFQSLVSSVKTQSPAPSYNNIVYNSSPTTQSPFPIQTSGVSSLTYNNTSASIISQPTSGDLQGVLDQLTSTYNFNSAQVNAIRQVAFSYQNILNTRPSNQAQYLEISRKDVAALNCASSRIPANILDVVYSKIENAVFNTPQKKAVYDNYSNAMTESNTVVPVVVDACEDQYTNNNSQIVNGGQVTGATYPTIPNGIVPDNKINYPCTVLTSFLEYGSKLPQVLTLQRFLSDVGYLEMWPTGYYGRNTEAAVRLWQSRHNVDIRGYVGPNTRASIARVTCKGDATSIDRATRGVVAVAPKKTTTPAVKKLTTVPVKKPVAQPTVVIKPTNVNTPVEDNTQIVTPPVYENNTSSGNLSVNSSTFYTKRSPINTIYFTYKANVSRDVTYICFEKSEDNSCSSSNSFSELKAQYQPGNYDAIPNGDKWIINLYFNSSKWANGGKIYLRNNLSSVSDIFVVNTRDSL